MACRRSSLVVRSSSSRTVPAVLDRVAVDSTRRIRTYEMYFYLISTIVVRSHDGFY